MDIGQRIDGEIIHKSQVTGHSWNTFDLHREEAVFLLDEILERGETFK